MDIAGDTVRAWAILSAKITGWASGAVAMLPNLLVAVLVMFAFWVGAALASKGVKRLLHHTSESLTVTNLLSTFTKLFILFFGLFTALGILNLDKTVASLLAGAGVIGLAIGFAFQEIAANFFSGILIALRKPYRENDIIQIEDHVGTVSEINLRTTNLRTFQGLEILVPNKDMFTKPVINYTKTPERRVELTVGISYGEDLQKVEDVTVAAVSEVKERVQERKVEFFYQEFGDSSINFQVRFWIDYSMHMDIVKAKHQAIVAIKNAFDKHDIMIPFPIRTLDFGIRGGVTLKEQIKNPLRRLNEREGSIEPSETENP